MTPAVPLAHHLLPAQRNMSSSAVTDGKPGRVTLPAASFSLGPGDVLGCKYRIESQVAEGGMGVVLRATHLDLGCQVAIKLIRPEYAANEEVVARLLSEARIAASLRSKHVNHVLDVGRTDDGVPYLVLEYMEGSDLANYLMRCGPLAVSEAVDHVLAACEALAEAHAIGIVHRDLKPENLFLSEDADGGFVLKVFDFGISKSPATREPGRTLTGPGAVVGSPCYMSPEQISGAAVDARSDIWALGTMLYELCTGQLLFRAESVSETFAQILAPDRELPALEVGPASEPLRRILGKCLQHSADDRYQTVVELAQDLAPLGSDPAQAARVAKVAAAARARAIGMRSDATPIGTGTPFALSTSQLEAEAVARSAPPSSRWQWLAVSLAAAVALAVGAGYLAKAIARRPAALAPLPVEAPAPAAAQPTTPASDKAPAPVIAEPSLLAPAPEVKLPVAPAALSSPRVQPRPRPTNAWHPPTPEVPPPTLSVVMTPAAPPPSPPPPPASAPPPPAATATAGDVGNAAVDAWNPNLFGGRR